MNELITQLIASAIDASKIPTFYSIDATDRASGIFRIILRSGTVIRITVNIEKA